ncbi:MAG: c-type cytochrome [Planctomycetota bacterium]
MRDVFLVSESKSLLTSILLLCVSMLNCGVVLATPQVHDHGGDDKVKPPRVFLDKSRRIVDFQLKRLDNQKLLLVERSDDDKKYVPVHEAILKRDGMTSGDLEAALAALVKINQSSPIEELIQLIEALDLKQSSDRRIATQLAKLVGSQPPAVLLDAKKKLKSIISSENMVLRRIGFGGLMASADASTMNEALQMATENRKYRASLLSAVPTIARQDIRNRAWDFAIASLEPSMSYSVRRPAVTALEFIDAKPKQTFKAVAQLIESNSVRRQVIRTLKSIKRENRDPEVATSLATFLVQHAESTPAAERTTNEFLEAMQLMDQLLGLIDAKTAKAYRARLDEVTVRVILIHTVEEEMRYDIPWFAVEAGREFQVVLQNEDLMPHNIVFTQPGKLRDVALEGAAIGPKIGSSGKQYVPVSEDVIAASEMVPAEGQTRMTFKAPAEPGEYPFVCTFPGHWMRMYGVMVVVDDLAAFQRTPVEPKDPIGSDRAFVKNWTAADFAGKLDDGLRGRTKTIGKKIFTEATCATCHVVAGEGQQVGPELTDVWKRWKGDSAGVLREILEPSHKIDAKYVVRKVITLDGIVVSGIVVSEDDKQMALLPTPEAKEPTIVLKDDVDDMMDSSISLMPKALMDRFTEDEILELMAYLRDAEAK